MWESKYLMKATKPVKWKTVHIASYEDYKERFCFWLQYDFNILFYSIVSRRYMLLLYKIWDTSLKEYFRCHINEDYVDFFK